MPGIHPSAVVAADAELAADVEIGPFAVVESGVVVGSGTRLLAGTVLLGGSRIGAGCRLGPYAVVGGPPMDTEFRGEESFAVLEDAVEVREFATVHRATGTAAETRIGTGTLLMSYVHVSHNVSIGAGATLATSVQLGGHVQVGAHAFLGANALVHQFCRVGTYAMFGAGSGTNRDILPFCLVSGAPARHYRLNRVGLHRRGIVGERYALLERGFRALRDNDRDTFDALAAASQDIALMQRFRAESRRGVARFITGRS